MNISRSISNFSTLDLDSRCAGCTNIAKDYMICSMYTDQAQQWTKLGGCAGRSHNKSVKEDQKLSTDSIKVSKRKAGVK